MGSGEEREAFPVPQAGNGSKDSFIMLLLNAKSCLQGVTCFGSSDYSCQRRTMPVIIWMKNRLRKAK
jgi:hypothetical protein